MKRILYFALSASAFLLLTPVWGQQSSEARSVFIYKADGTRHCETTSGISLDSMAQELIRNGIPVLSKRKAYDGREGIAVCGNPTGGINVYEIAKPDLIQALQLGFQRLLPSWLEAQ